MNFILKELVKTALIAILKKIPDYLLEKGKTENKKQD